MYSDKQLTDLTQGSNISWSCSTILTLCIGHRTPLSHKVCALGISRMSFFCFLLCLGILRSLGSPLSFRLMQHSKDVNASFSEWVPSENPSQNSSFLAQFLLRIIPGANHVHPCLNRYLHSPNIPLSATGRVLFCNPSLLIRTPVVMGPLVVPQLPHGHAASQQPKINWLLLGSWESMTLFGWLLVVWSATGW